MLRETHNVDIGNVQFAELVINMFVRGISQEWLVLFAAMHPEGAAGGRSCRCGKGCFHVSGERGVPAGGAGKYPEVLLDGEDYHKGRRGVSVWV